MVLDGGRGSPPPAPRASSDAGPGAAAAAGGRLAIDLGGGRRLSALRSLPASLASRCSRSLSRTAEHGRL